MAKHIIDFPDETLHQLNILKGVGKFENIPETALYVINLNLGDLVSKEAKTLRREIKKERKDPDADTYTKEDTDTKKTKKMLKEKEKKQ